MNQQEAELYVLRRQRDNFLLAASAAETQLVLTSQEADGLRKALQAAQKELEEIKAGRGEVIQPE